MRPELRKEFRNKTKQTIWIYATDYFVEQVTKHTGQQLQASIRAEISSKTAARQRDTLATLAKETAASTGSALRLAEVGRTIDPTFLQRVHAEPALAALAGLDSSRFFQEWVKQLPSTRLLEYAKGQEDALRSIMSISHLPNVHHSGLFAEIWEKYSAPKVEPSLPSAIQSDAGAPKGDDDDSK